jgi:3-hydroxyacyl-CoA dehydrogenase/enoyl-CoA hydratase/3-hydroxybutyryl-CoA epimerase
MSEAHMETTGGAFRVDSSTSGIAVLVFDYPGEKVNLLTPAVLEELRGHLERLGNDASVRGLLVVSGKTGHFCAGADVSEIRAVQEASEGQSKAAEGQAIYQRLADFPVPTCAAIDGACMGGGLELALACGYRIGSDAASTTLAVPEVRLGILPAFGGTTRLPKLLGLPAALDMLLTGRNVKARKARRTGLLDEVLPKENFRQRALRLFSEWVQTEESIRAGGRGRGADPAKICRRRKPPRMMRFLSTNALGRNYVLGQAEKQVHAESKGHYPAPLRILDVVRKSAGRPLAEALWQEAMAAGDLIVTPESRNLAGLFFLMEGAKKTPPTPAARAVDSVAVLGAGVMGGGIATLFARSDMSVRMKDIEHSAVAGGLAAARRLFERDCKRRRMDRRELEQRMGLISGTLEYTGFRRLDVVVEAVVESLEIKRKVLAEVEELVGESTVLATNTSAIGIESLSESLKRPQQLVGLHFFNPVHRMPLVEVVVGRNTGGEARDTAVALTRKLGKTPVVVRSSPGFLVNRVLMPYLMEALHLFQRGVLIEDLDQAMEDFGMPMGPLALLDEVGLDVALHVSEVLLAAFPDRGDPPDILKPMVDGGRLGRKNGRGFYLHSSDGKKPDPAVYSLATRPSRAAVQAGAESWVERLMFVMINEAVRCLEEDIVADPGQLDLAMIMGTGFPPFRGGLMRYADTRGAGRVANRLQALADSESPRFEPAQLLKEFAASRSRFRTDFPH